MQYSWMIPYCQLAAWHIIPTIWWLLRLLNLTSRKPLTFLYICAGVLLPLLLAVALRGHLVFCTNWLHVVFSLGLPSSTSFLRYVLCTCPVWPLWLYQQSCTVTLMCMLLILSIHITSKDISLTSISASGLLTSYTHNIAGLTTIVWSSFPPPLPS